MEDLLAKMQELLSDPESMKQISELAQMLKSGETEASAPMPEQTEPLPESSALPDFKGLDPGLLLKAGEMFGHQKPDKNTALLLALRPHLGQERQAKLDRAVRLLKLWNLWKQLQDTGMLKNLL